MLTHVHPKLPMRSKALTQNFYINGLGFQTFDGEEYAEYLMIYKDHIEIHFFLFPDLNPKENDGQVYIRCEGIEQVYQDFIDRKITIHPNNPLQQKPWGMREFSLLDPDHNLLTFGEDI
jgi:hypothetical protein